MRTKTKRIIFLLVLAVVLTTAIPAVKNNISSLTYDAGYLSVRDYSIKYDINIHFISTYNSDCILVDCGGKYILIDGGYYSLYSDIDAYLKEVGVKELAAVINTHPDGDHIGCLPYILENYKTDTFYCSSASKYFESPENTYMLDSAKEQGISTVFLSAGDEFTIEGFKFNVVAPIKYNDESNRMSLVIQLTKDDFSALFTGDAYKEELMEAYNNGYSLKSDILKVPHHGSNTSTTEELIDIIAPEYAVITVNKNYHGHPHQEVLDIFEKKQIPLLLTENSGTIIISSNCDGKYIINSVHSGG